MFGFDPILKAVEFRKTFPLVARNYTLACTVLPSRAHKDRLLYVTRWSVSDYAALYAKLTCECQLTSRTTTEREAGGRSTGSGSEGSKEIGNVFERSRTWTTRPSRDHIYHSSQLSQYLVGLERLTCILPSAEPEYMYREPVLSMGLKWHRIRVRRTA